MAEAATDNRAVAAGSAAPELVDEHRASRRFRVRGLDCRPHVSSRLLSVERLTVMRGSVSDSVEVRTLAEIVGDGDPRRRRAGCDPTETIRIGEHPHWRPFAIEKRAPKRVGSREDAAGVWLELPLRGRFREKLDGVETIPLIAGNSGHVRGWVYRNVWTLVRLRVASVSTDREESHTGEARSKTPLDGTRNAA